MDQRKWQEIVPHVTIIDEGDTWLATVTYIPAYRMRGRRFQYRTLKSEVPDSNMAKNAAAMAAANSIA